MHSQATDFKTADCVLETGLGLLLGAGSHVRRGGGALSLYSLLPEAGFLADKGAIPLPPPGAPQQPNQQSSQVSPPPTHRTQDGRTDEWMDCAVGFCCALDSGPSRVHLFRDTCRDGSVAFRAECLKPWGWGIPSLCSSHL